MVCIYSHAVEMNTVKPIVELLNLFLHFCRKMVVAASSNAIEVSMVAKQLTEADGAWQRWNLEDSSRAEMPMTSDYNETFPVGVGVDLTSQAPIPIGDNQTHPASPILLLLSSDGVVSAFHMIYMRNDAPNVQKPSIDPIDSNSARPPMSKTSIHVAPCLIEFLSSSFVQVLFVIVA